MINTALREYMKRRDGALAETLRAVIREEIAPYIVGPASRGGRKRSRA